jgi:L-Ala-D/L-Glu epimerase
MTGIERVELDLLKIPLKTPYKLTFGNVDAFDTLLVTLTLADGSVGIGEATILTGYTNETVGQCWQAAYTIDPNLLGLQKADVDNRIKLWAGDNPFTAAAFATALEMALRHATLRSGGEVPLLAILNETAPGWIENNTSSRLGPRVCMMSACLAKSGVCCCRKTQYVAR